MFAGLLSAKQKQSSTLSPKIVLSQKYLQIFILDRSYCVTLPIHLTSSFSLDSMAQCSGFIQRDFIYSVRVFSDMLFVAAGAQGIDAYRFVASSANGLPSLFDISYLETISK